MLAADTLQHKRAAAPQLSSERFLGDVARVEWVLHRAATAADSKADIGSFALFASAYPVVSIIHARLQGKPALAQLAVLLGGGLRTRAGLAPGP